MRITRLVLLLSVFALVLAPVALALRFTDAARHPPFGETGKPYNWSYTGAGGCGPALPYQWKVQNGSLPPGLTLDSSGLVHGIPTQAGDYTFWVQLSDQNPPSASWCTPRTSQEQSTIKIIEGLRIVQNQSTLPPAVPNKPYSYQFSASGGGTQTWSIVPDYGSGPPPGITIDPNTGLLSGTATTAGDYTFRVKVTDQTRTDIQTYSLSVVDPLVIARVGVPAAEVGRPFTVTATATGGRGAHTWSLAAGTLPAGLQLDAATGTITGTPTAAGSYAVKLMATDQANQQVTVDVDVPVAAHLALVKKHLRAATVGNAFRARLVATGGVAPRAWRILRGSLPAGIKFDKRRGVLSGKPTAAGTARLYVQVRDRLGVISRARFVLKVKT
jgi:hypothetical protein